MKLKIFGLFLLAATLAFTTAGMAQDSNNNANNQDNAAPPPSNSAQQPQNNAVPETQDSTGAVVLIDPGKIYNEDPTSWVGKQVTLQNVIVEEADKAGNFWVGSDNHHRLFVVKNKSNPNLAAKEFHKGDIVTINGVIHPAGEVEAQENSASSGKMNKARHGAGVFMLADDVQIASSTQHK